MKRQIRLAMIVGAIPLTVFVARLGRTTSASAPTSAEHSVAQQVAPTALAGESSARALAILERAESAWQMVDDYQCLVDTTNRQGEVLVETTLHVTFKRPGQFRHSIVKGDNTGVLLTRTADGSVRVRPGGFLGLVTVEMDPGDSRLLDGRGRPFYENDWGSELEAIRAALSRGARLDRVADQVWNGVDCWVIRLTLPGPVDERQELWIDQQTHLPRRISASEGGRVKKDARFEQITLNTRPADQVFMLK